VELITSQNSFERLTQHNCNQITHPVRWCALAVQCLGRKRASVRSLRQGDWRGERRLQVIKYTIYSRNSRPRTIPASWFFTVKLRKNPRIFHAFIFCLELIHDTPFVYRSCTCSWRALQTSGCPVSWVAREFPNFTRSTCYTILGCSVFVFSSSVYWLRAKS
jgi:hypothetical protein